MDNPGKVEIADARRVAEVVYQFYGLPKAVDDSITVKSNIVIVADGSWIARQRIETMYEVPPVLWTRGGRVYDFHGDRGTVQEFESDFLVRGVEDDSVCRNRRREQGLQPCPFAALPLKQRGTEDDADGDALEEPRDGARPSRRSVQGSVPVRGRQASRGSASIIAPSARA